MVLSAPRPEEEARTGTSRASSLDMRERSTSEERLHRTVTTDQRHALIALNAELAVPRARLCSLARRILDHGALCARSAPELAGSEAAARALRHRDLLAGREVERAETAGSSVVTILDADYPTELLDLDLPPPVLYIRGELTRTSRLGIVGSRHADRWALASAQQIAAAVAGAGFPVVSGFALGVDIAAHRAAADAGETVAVLGCGLARPYPRQHHDFAETLARRGALITEFPLDANPKPQNFPVRNRIIAALSRCTLVVQAARRSGALITARYAAELGRDVAALPGRPSDARSAGANLLLRDGAHVVLEPADALTLLGCETSGETAEKGTPRNALLERIAASPQSLDELVESTGRSAADLQASLLDLEIDGLIENVAGRWLRSPSN